MPASSFDMYYMNDRRNNLGAMRPAPICTENQVSGHNNVHISTNCYYGYHHPKIGAENAIATDYEMAEPNAAASNKAQSAAVRKRSAGDVGFPPMKRHRQDKIKKHDKTIEPETTGKRKVEEDILAAILWNTHGGHLYHFV